MADLAVAETVIIRVDRFRAWLPQLVNAVAEIGEMTPTELVAPCRKGTPVRLRAAITIAAVDVMEKKWAEIGRALGGRNHGTIITAYQHGRARLDFDPEFRKLAEQVFAIARVIAGLPAAMPGIDPEPAP